MTSQVWALIVMVNITDGKATRAAIEDALLSELDTDIETEGGAVLSLTVTFAERKSAHRKATVPE